jgi:hypothetical protein
LCRLFQTCRTIVVYLSEVLKSIFTESTSGDWIWLIFFLVTLDLDESFQVSRDLDFFDSVMSDKVVLSQLSSTLETVENEDTLDTVTILSKYTFPQFRVDSHSRHE